RVLGTDTRIVETRRDGMRLLDLAVVVVEEQRIASMQHTGTAVRDGRGRLAERLSAAARFDAEQGHARVVHERMKQADGVRASADAGHRDGRRDARPRTICTSRRRYGWGCGPTAEPSR